MGNKYKNKKATLNKKINKLKTEYINKKLDKSSHRWKTLKEINNTKSFTSPRSITHKDEITTNIREICNIANNYYIESFRIRRENIPSITTTPIEILKKIYPRVETTLEIPIPTTKDITDIIKKSKSKNSVGHDNISMKMLKKTTKIMAPLITRLTKQ